MGLLFDRWNQTREGRGQAVMLAADAGLGKSRLVHVLKEHVTVDDNPPDRRMALLAVSRELRPLSGHRLLGAHASASRRGTRRREQLERLKEYLRGFDLPLAESVPLFGSLMSLPEDDEYPAPALAPQRQKELTTELITAWLAAKATHDAAALHRRGPALDRPVHARPARLARRHTAGRADHAASSPSVPSSAIPGPVGA